DLTRSRIEIESILLRWSIARGGVEWEAELIGALHRLSSVPKPAPSGHLDGDSTWFRYHRAFHLALVAACDSPILLSIGRRLFDQAERYVALSIASKGALRDDVGEHAAIMEAAIARDVERAVTLNREHIERTADKIEHA